jgi:CheY-like chemotaxis protein/AraC-like DNA-binding protein
MFSIVVRNLLVCAIKTSVLENIAVKSEENEDKILISITHHVSDFILGQYRHLLQETTPEFSETHSGALSSLALTIVREFVRINNGVVTVTRDDDSRLTCHISFPKAVQAVKKKAPTEEKKRQPSILVADESAELRTYIRRILSPQFKILEAANGKDALAIAQKFIPEIIISEVLLPELDGFQLCQNIKSEEVTSDVPFIFLTSEWEESKRNTGLQVGASVYLVKPVSKELLLQTISNATLKKQETTFPTASTQIFKTSESEDFLDKVMRIIEENLADPDLDHRRICEHMAMSKSVLYTKFRNVTGLGVQEFIKSIRLEKSLKLLIDGGMTINQVAIEVGFNSQSYYNKCFMKQYGIGPREYARKNKKTAHFSV